MEMSQMFKWQTGRDAPLKLSLHWILGIVCLLLSLLIAQHVYAWTAQKTLAGNPPGDAPVIVLLLAVGVAGMGWRWKRKS